MKRRLALGALVVLGGLLSLGAVLMLAAFVTGTSVSATHWYPLGIGRNHVDVGMVQVDNDPTNLNVRYSTDSPWCLTEVHVCISDQPFTWVAPGSAKKCEAVGGVHRGFELNTCTDNYVVTIPLAELGDLATLCPSVYIQAHAVVMNQCTGKEETAYGDEFKASFEHDLCYCS